MNIHDKDDDLREAFSTMRREEQAQATPFSELIRAEVGQRGVYRRAASAPILVGIAILAALGFIVGLELRNARPSTSVEVSLATWIEPTAFLLKTPGQEILYSVPAFGRDKPPIGGPASPTNPSSHIN